MGHPRLGSLRNSRRQHSRRPQRAGRLFKNTAAGFGRLGFEWKPGWDFRTAAAYADKRTPPHTMRGHDFGAVDTNGEYVRKAAAAPAAPSDYVMKLDPYGYALVHKKLAATEAALTKAGWKRVYGIYQGVRQKQGATAPDCLQRKQNRLRITFMQP